MHGAVRFIVLWYLRLQRRVDDDDRWLFAKRKQMCIWTIFSRFFRSLFRARSHRINGNDGVVVILCPQTIFSSLKHGTFGCFDSCLGLNWSVWQRQQLSVILFPYSQHFVLLFDYLFAQRKIDAMGSFHCLHSPSSHRTALPWMHCEEDANFFFYFFILVDHIYSCSLFFRTNKIEKWKRTERWPCAWPLALHRKSRFSVSSQVERNPRS